MLQFFKKSGHKKASSNIHATSSPSTSPRANSAEAAPNNVEKIRNSSDGHSLLGRLEVEEEDIYSLHVDSSDCCSRLTKSLKQILADKGALGYFIQFMDKRGSLGMIKFWLEVECIRDSCPLSLEETRRDRNENGSESDRFCGDETTESNWRYEPAGDTNSMPGRQVSSARQDAMRIYKKYIASELLPIECRDLPGQCNEDADKLLECDNNLEPLIQYLTAVQRNVYKTLENEYTDDFLRSDFHCKHQIDVLTSGDVKLADILYNETAFFYFMEFMELEKKRELLDFWMIAVNYKQNLLGKSGGIDSSEAESDALIIYEKYFSLQATVPLGLTDKTRFQVEQNICREGGDGPQPDCFDRPCTIVYNFLSKHYLPAFLSSQLYYKYLSELIGTIQSSACSNIRQPRVRKAGSDCSSEISTFSMQDTTTGQSEASFTIENDNRRNINNNGNMDIDTSQLYDPDSLWRREKSSLSVGYVDDMGRFVTEIEPDPRRKYESRLTRAVKRFIHIEQDKAKEELAWKIAEMIVREITSLTLGERDETTT